MELPEGFLGVREVVVSEASLVGDHAHVLRLVRYRFPGGHAEVFIEVEEVGESYRGSRLVSLSDTVHALLNLGEMELWQVGNRERDWRGAATLLAGVTPGE